MKGIVCVAAMCVAMAAWAAEDTAQDTKALSAQELKAVFDELDEKLKADPDSLDLHVLKCKALFASGREQEAIDFSKTARAKFIQAKNNLAWFIAGAIRTEHYRIDVHCNMGPQERANPAEVMILMTRPYSFRVWTLGESPQLVKAVDFEICYMGGKPSTAAIGQTQGGLHTNYGMLETDADFATVKAAVLALLKPKN